jgi:hypothetical protein
MSSTAFPVHQLDPALPPAEVIKGLEPAVRRLVVAVKTLYAGSWDDCAEDIRRRRAGRPFLFKLALGLQDDLDWIHRLQAYEAARGEPFAIDGEAAALPGNPPQEDL